MRWAEPSAISSAGASTNVARVDLRERRKAAGNMRIPAPPAPRKNRLSPPPLTCSATTS